MRIIHIVPSYIPAYRYGGPIYSVHGLCRALAARGHDIRVFTTNIDGDRDSRVQLEHPVDIDGVKVRYFRSEHLRRLYYSRDMQRALGREMGAFDVAHMHSLFLWPTWAAAKAARKNGVPYIISPRGMLVKDLIAKKSRLVKSAWLTLIERENLEKAAAIHVTSRAEEDEARKFGYAFPHFFEVPNGIDLPADDSVTADSSDRDPVVPGGKYILFLGRISWKKGLDRLIRALPQIPVVRLVIAGNDDEGYRKELEKIAGQNRVMERITFTGPVHGSSKNSLFRNASLFVLLSYSENFGNTVLEAMAAGCPVVVTPEVGLSAVVRETGAGLVIEGDPEKVGKGIKDLLDDAPQRQRMGMAGQKTALTRFTWMAAAHQMECIYQNISDKKIGDDE